MRFWNKLTFSLVSLVLLMVSLTVQVQAHAPSRIGKLRTHSHPTHALAAQDGNNDDDTLDVGEAAVEAHNTHPEVVSITLKPSATRVNGNHVKITADTDGSSTTPTTGNGNNQFTLVIDFDVDISNTTIGIGSLTQSVLNANIVNLPTGEVEILQADITQVSTDHSKFEVQVTIDPDSDSSDTSDADEAIPNGTAGNALEKLYFRIQVNADAVRSLSTTVTPPNSVVSETAEGSCNPASTVYEFVLVNTRPEDTAPTLAITHSPADSTALGNDGMVTFTFTWTDTSGIATTGADAFTKSDVTITGGTKGTFASTSNKVYTLKVTPTTQYTDATVTVAKGSVKDASPVPNGLAADVTETWSAPSDTTAPTLAITHTPADSTELGNDGMVTFTFTFTDPSGIATTGAGAFTKSDITITGGTKGTFTKALISFIR